MHLIIKYAVKLIEIFKFESCFDSFFNKIISVTHHYF